MWQNMVKYYLNYLGGWWHENINMKTLTNMIFKCFFKENCINSLNIVSAICSCFNFCLNLKLCLVGAC